MSDNRERFNDLIRYAMLLTPLAPLAILWQLNGHNDKWAHVIITFLLYCLGLHSLWWWVLAVFYAGGLVRSRREKSESEITRIQLQQARIRAIHGGENKNGN